MNTQYSPTRARPAADPAATGSHPPPRASLVDRVALQLGLALVAWGRRSRHAETERNRSVRARAERRSAATALRRANAAERAYRSLRLREERERREAEYLRRAYLGSPHR
jgi:hypothetical protein